MTASVQRVQKPTDNPTGPSAGGIRRLIGVGAVGAAVALAVGVYGRSHVPTGVTIAPLRPSQMLGFKSALATMGAALAIGQLASAAWLYGRIGRGRVPRWVGPAHRWLGTAAFVVTLPVAYHCLWSLGFQTTTPRVLIHSLLGCAFYGAFATKLLMLRASRVPAWAVPLVGGGPGGVAGWPVVQLRPVVLHPGRLSRWRHSPPDPGRPDPAAPIRADWHDNDN